MSGVIHVSLTSSLLLTSSNGCRLVVDSAVVIYVYCKAKRCSATVMNKEGEKGMESIRVEVILNSQRGSKSLSFLAKEEK